MGGDEINLDQNTKAKKYSNLAQHSNSHPFGYKNEWGTQEDEEIFRRYDPKTSKSFFRRLLEQNKEEKNGSNSN